MDPGAAPAQGAGGDKMDAFIGMVEQTDGAIEQIGQALAEMSPEAAQAIGQIQAQFRKVIEAAMAGGQAQGGGRQAAEIPVDANVGGSSRAQQSY